MPSTANCRTDRDVNLSSSKNTKKAVSQIIIKTCKCMTDWKTDTHIEVAKPLTNDMPYTFGLGSGRVRDSLASVIFHISFPSCIFISAVMGKHKATDPCPQLTEMEQPRGIILLKKTSRKKNHWDGWLESSLLPPLRNQGTSWLWVRGKVKGMLGYPRAAGVIEDDLLSLSLRFNKSASRDSQLLGLKDDATASNEQRKSVRQTERMRVRGEHLLPPTAPTNSPQREARLKSSANSSAEGGDLIPHFRLR
ncbi:hypothetical protein QQF64_014228 [Cirrhinus molitorella]|uniref:Uncharacterized protein n=1 Tax=Cirrhinus molitorella TaxID=172907 RepID=A0ABR3LX06_9TELE